jgi:cell division septum initiation protein DivIVA
MEDEVKTPRQRAIDMLTLAAVFAPDDMVHGGIIVRGPTKTPKQPTEAEIQAMTKEIEEHEARVEAGAKRAIERLAAARDKMGADLFDAIVTVIRENVGEDYSGGMYGEEDAVVDIADLADNWPRLRA